MKPNMNSSLLIRQWIKRQKTEMNYFKNTKKEFLEIRVNKPYSHPIVECYLHLKKLFIINSIVKKYLNKFGKNLKILNICAGGGMEAEFILKGNPALKIIAIDLSKEMCSYSLIRARRKNLVQNLDIICADGSRLPFKNAIAQMVFFYDGLHHIPHYKQAIKESNRLLKDDGYILLSEPFISKLINLIITRLKYQRKEYFGFATYKFLLDEMKEFFSKINYNLILVNKMWDFYPKTIIKLIERHPGLLIFYKILDKLLNILSYLFLYCTSIILFQKRFKNYK